MHSFYIGAPEEGSAWLLPEECRHARQVLRLQTGEAVTAMDGDGNRYRASIDYMGEDGVRVRLDEPLPTGEAPVRICVYQGLPKADKLEFIAQKLTELGAAGLVPVKMERCVVRLDAKDGKKRQERLERIAREAAKQCRRAKAPEVLQPMSWREAQQRLAAHELVIVPWEEASGGRVKDVFAQRPDARDIGIVIGPEGGMSEQEVCALKGLGAVPVTLGPRILRAETAAVVSAAMAMQLWGDL